MTLNSACGYYEHVCKCIVVYLLNHTHQSKFNSFINHTRIYKALGILNRYPIECFRYDIK